MTSWRPASVSRGSAVLDFRSSGPGRVEVTQLVADGVVLANAVHLTRWEARESQAIVCASCGIEGCEQGGWVSVRRAGDFVLCLPALRDDTASAERAPPPYVRERGVLVLGADAPGPCADGGWRACRQLSRRELALAIRGSAPAALFDADGLRVDRVDWVSSGMPVERARELDALLAEARDDDGPSTLRAFAADDEPIEIRAEPVEPWAPLVLVAGRARLSIAGLVEARD